MKLFLLILCTLLCQSCFEMDQEIKIFNDGSAKITLYYSFDKNMVNILRDTEGAVQKLEFKDARIASLDEIRIFSKVKLEEMLTSFKEVELSKFRVKKVNDKVYCYIEIFTKDLEKSLGNGLLSYHSFSKKDGKYSCAFPFISKEITLNKKLVETIKGTVLKYRIIAPNEILKTNGKKSAKNTVLYSYTIKDQQSLKNLPQEFFVEYDIKEKKIFAK